MVEVFKPKLKQGEEDLFFNILRSDLKMNLDDFDVLKYKYKEDIFLWFSIFAGKTVKFPKIRKLRDIFMKVKVYNMVVKKIEDGKNFDDVIVQVADEIKLSVNQIFQCYNSVIDVLDSKY